MFLLKQLFETMQLEVVANLRLSLDGSSYAVWFYMFAISHVS